MVRKYILNFWIWWYAVQFRRIFRMVYSFWSLSLANLNILPMLSNLFIPMFGDKSTISKIMSFFMRLGWILFGMLLMVVLTVPLILILVVWIVLPIVTILQICRFTL